MSEWDVGGGFEEEQGKGRKNSPATGGLHAALTVSCLIVVTLVSFLTAYLMRDHVRTFWEMGLSFMAPFAALMITAYLVEKNMRRMTPDTSRNGQMLFAAVTIVAAFVIGCVAEVVHQPVIIEHVEPEYDYLIVVDKSGSMNFNHLEEPCAKALNGLLDGMEDQNRVGIVAFDDVIRGRADMALLDENQRAKIREIINIPILIHNDEESGKIVTYGAGTAFSVAMEEVIRTAEKETDRTRTLRIILVTDGDNASYGNFNEFEKWANKLNSAGEQKQVELCAIQLGETPMLDMVKHAVTTTEGTIYDGTDISELLTRLQSLKSTAIIPEKIDTLKATYNGQTADGKSNTPYMIVSAVLLVLQGLLCGFSLLMMFSVAHQFRIQVILSAVMGICAFLLMNYGRMLGIAPAWVCEGLAFSLFGIVLMRQNVSGNRAPSPESKAGKGSAGQPAAADVSGFDDF